MRIEKVTSPQAETWMHIRRLTHGQKKQWISAPREDTQAYETNLVAMCLCMENGSLKHADLAASCSYVDSLDWKLVREIYDQAFAMNEFDTTPADAEKNS